VLLYNVVIPFVNDLAITGKSLQKRAHTCVLVTSIRNLHSNPLLETLDLLSSCMHFFHLLRLDLGVCVGWGSVLVRAKFISASTR